MQGTEELLWTGRPDRHTGFSVWTHIVVPFACLWLYFVPFILVSTLTALHDQPVRVQALMFLSFFLMIFAFVVIRVVYSVSRANTYYYALTNQRAFILQRSRGESYASHFFNSTSEVQKLVRKNGQIQVVFGDAQMRNFQFG